jgi:hypothetical protein
MTHHDEMDHYKVTSTASDSSPMELDLSQAKSDERETPDFSKALPAKRGAALPLSAIEQIRLDAGVRARAARDAFQQVLEHRTRGDMEGADAALSEAKDRTIEMWNYTSVRSDAFRSLLGAIDAALGYRTIADFGDAQLNCLFAAYVDLPRSSLEQANVSAHLDAFAEIGIDIMAPLTERPDGSSGIRIEPIK